MGSILIYLRLHLFQEHKVLHELKFVIMSFDLLGRARLILEEGKVIFLTLIEPFLILV